RREQRARLSGWRISDAPGMGPSLSPLKGGEGTLGAPRSGSQHDAEVVGDGEDVLVAAAAHIHDHQMIARQLGRDLRDMGQRMRRLEGRDNTLLPAAQPKS